ncbi:MAG: hypothetical protein LBH28_04710 [Oscillospiraceae bacterium]|jgi:hypothetical protein|nr:hypothetical protein [Oscillospiraceae bacterium]
MKYPRPEYLDPSIKTQEVDMVFSSAVVTAPLFDTTITPRENFRRSITRSNPLWLPNSLTEKISLNTNDVIAHSVRGMQIHSDFHKKAVEDYHFKDWFNTDWTWVCSAGGAMLKPGTQLMDDITKWEKLVVFPNLDEWGFDEKADEFMKTKYNPKKALSYDIGRGMTERLVSVMGGYTDAMEALLIEPEAVSDFFDAYCNFMIRVFDRLSSLYPLDIITLHDDWGTERDTFFSERVMEELVFEPTKRLIDHIKDAGVFLELHTCGNVTRFFPYMTELKCDIAQVQRRAVNMPEMKIKYGDRIGFCAGLEGIDITKSPQPEEYVSAARKTVDIYAPGGGSYLNVFTPDSRLLWEICAENYCYSMEIYDNLR